MKLLALLRHAKSDWGASVKRDFDRGLNSRGCRGASVIGQHIGAHGIAFDRLVASPARRVKVTLNEAKLGIAPQYDERLYLASTEVICDVARETDDTVTNLLIAGHNPGLADMVFELVAPRNENALFKEACAKFPTAAYAVFELDIDSWDELREGCGRLIHFARPRDLDPDLGPEE